MRLSTALSFISASSVSRRTPFLSTRHLVIGVVCGLAATSGAVLMKPIGKPLPPNMLAAHVSGTLSTSSMVHFTVSVQPRDLAGLQAAVNDVSNPASPNYQKFLTPGQVAAKYGALPADLTAISTYLKSKGLKITLQARNGMGFLVKGTVAQVQAALGTTLKSMKGVDLEGHPINFRTNTTPLQMPANLVGKIVDISGVDTFKRCQARGNTQTLTPTLARKLYNLDVQYKNPNNFTGSGRTVAISNWDGYRLSNVPIFVSTYGLAVPPGGVGSNIQIVPIGQPAGPGNPAGEADLDIQMCLATASLATLQIYDNAGFDLVGVLTKESSDDTADVISESWGWNLDNNTLNGAHNQHLVMSVQGQTYMAASGDSGTSLEPFSYPGCDPEVLMVGGTVATVDDGPNFARIVEVAWDGGGGGWSTKPISFNTLPSYLFGTGVPTNINFRILPDIAAQAGGPGAFDVVYNGSITQFDGTSCSSPFCAGGFIQVEQRLEALGITSRLGRVADFIYSLDGDPNCFFDVTVGQNGQLPNGASSNAGVAWDFCTGWGAPDFDGIFNALSTGGGGFTNHPPDNPVVASIGTYAVGDAASLSTLDGVNFEVDSATFPQFGTAAAIDATFTLPETPSQVKVQFIASGNADGGAGMVWAMNWNTSTWELIGSAALSTNQPSTPASIKIQPSKLANYVNGLNQVMLRLRGHYPDRPLSQVPAGDFTFQVDLLQLATR